VYRTLSVQPWLTRLSWRIYQRSWSPTNDLQHGPDHVLGSAAKAADEPITGLLFRRGNEPAAAVFACHRDSD